jgi:two-component system sensor kinase FixL
MAQSGIKPHEELHVPLQFERLLAEISTFFINLPADRIDNEIKAAQSRICELLDLDRSSLWLTSEDDHGMLLLTHFHQPPEISSPPERLSANDFWPWTVQKVLGGETLAISKVSELPEEAGRDRESYPMYGTKSVVVVPLSVERGKVFGALTFSITREQRDWPEAVLQQFQLVAQIFANALARKQAEKFLEERLRFERLLSNVSARFINISPEQVDGEIENALKMVIAYFRVDRCALLRTLTGKTAWQITHLVSSNDVPPLPAGVELPRSIYPWAYEKLTEKHEVVSISRLDDLPAEAKVDRQSCIEWGIRSYVNIPILICDYVDIIHVSSVKSERVWPQELFPRLRLLGEIFVNALERKRSEEAVKESEAKYRSLYESMMDGYVLVGLDGRILKYNESYRGITGYEPEELLRLSYPDITPEKWHTAEQEIIERQVLARGYSEVYEKEYRKKDGTVFPIELRTFLLRDEMGSNIGMWAIVRDITRRKLIESEARKLREDLAHVTRVSTLGELTSSLAHEINQPLAAILSNAQAAQRFLSQDKPDMKEVAEILGDIVRDDNRAAEVIRKIRSLLKKEETRYETLSLNDVIDEILNVVRNDTALTAVSIEKEYDPSLPFVWGDRIQLQQVILNLVLNAAEAMKEAGTDVRSLNVRTSKQDGRFAKVSIRDVGPGIEENSASRLFEPFYTTKAGGMGMGLAISKDIVKSHKGEIRVENNTDRGATFSFTVPLDSGVRR